MRFIFLTSLFLISIFANEVEKDLEKKYEGSHLKPIYEKELSTKEQAYQNYLKQKEEENKKLEEDGFCSCNND